VAEAARTEVHQRSAFPGTERGVNAISGGHEGRWQTDRRGRPRGAGKAPPDIPALKPYWGKPAVRNFRGDHGNGGIIRSPIRAMVLPGMGSIAERLAKQALGSIGVAQR
jgi:hypothetical protein